MATLNRVIRGVSKAVQKAHREQERQAKRIKAERIRQEKARIRQNTQLQKQIERENRERERQAKRIQKEQIRQEKAHQKQLIERGKLALAARVQRREQLKNSMLNLKVNI